MQNKGNGGWANRQTYDVQLWIGNDEEFHDNCRDLCKGALIWLLAEKKEDDYTEIDLREVYRTGGEQLEEMIIDIIPDEIDGMFKDLVRHSLEEVNWEEIAEALLDL